MGVRSGKRGSQRYDLGKPSPSRFKEIQRPWPMMRWSSSSISSNCPAAPISTVSATSAADVALTVELTRAGALLDIELLDHLIIGQGRWISLKRLGLGFPKA